MRNLIYFLLLSSGTLYAGNILKWVDEDGNIYYGDAPPADVKTEPVRVISAPSNPGKALPRLNDGESDQGEGSAGNQQAAARKLPQKERQAACEQANADLKVISSSSRIRIKSADGTTRQMSTEEISERREIAEKDIKLYCS